MEKNGTLIYSEHSEWALKKKGLWTTRSEEMLLTTEASSLCTYPKFSESNAYTAWLA